jgi:hypothetical protein
MAAARWLKDDEKYAGVITRDESGYNDNAATAIRLGLVHRFDPNLTGEISKITTTRDLVSDRCRVVIARKRDKEVFIVYVKFPTEKPNDFSFDLPLDDLTAAKLVLFLQ